MLLGLAVPLAMGIGDTATPDPTGLQRAERLRDYMPLLPSVHNPLAATESHRRSMGSMVADKAELEAVVVATERIVDPLNQPRAGLMVALPLHEAWGLQPSGSGRI